MSCKARYAVVKYIQGDVVGVYDSAGTKLVTFTYDAYGNCTIVSQQAGVGTLNPFRYRGYYWDSDLGLYYLQTRYYDPVTGRFINADGLEYLDPQTLGGINLYSYCGNNPIMETDPHGTFVLSAIIWGFIIGFAMSFTVSAVSQAIENDGEVNWDIAIVDGLFGGLSGALAATGLGSFATGVIDAGLDFVNGVITTGIENDWKISGQDIINIMYQTASSTILSVGLGKFGPDLDRAVLKSSNIAVQGINNKIIKGVYKKTDALLFAMETATKCVKYSFTQGHLKEHFIRNGVQQTIETILGVIEL